MSNNHLLLNLDLNKVKIFIFCVILSTSFGCKKEAKISKLSGDETLKEYRTQVNFIGQWLNEGNREMLVRNLAREYEFLNQDVHINLKFPEEVFYKREDLSSNQRFVAEQLKKEVGEWDVIRINNDFDGILGQIKDPLWAKKYLVDFSEYEEIKNHTLPELLSDSIKRIWNGIIPGPFIEGQYWAMWCNRTVANKVGITVKTNNVTFDDFESYCAAVYKYNQNNPSDQITTIFEAGDWQTLTSLTTQLFLSILGDEKEFYSGKFSHKKLDAWHKTLKLLERLAKYKPLADNWKDVAWGNTMGIMLEDKFLFYPNGSWMYNIWQQRDPKKLTTIFPTEFATINPTKSYPGGYVIMWAVPKNAPHKDEAIKFLLSFNTPSFSEKWIRTTKCPTGVTGSLTEVEFGGDEFENFSTRIQKSYGIRQYMQDASSARQLGAINSGIPSYVHHVLTGELSADQAISLIKSQLR